MHSKIEFNAKARARNLELPNGDQLPSHRAASSLICLLPLPLAVLLHHPLRVIRRLSPVSIANTKSWFRSRYISRSRRTAKFRPEVRSGLAGKSGLPDTNAEDLFFFFYGFFLLSFFFFLLFFFHSCKLAGNRSRLAPRLSAAAGSWLARLHKYYANIWSSPVTPRARAKSLRSCRSAGLCRRAR